MTPRKPQKTAADFMVIALSPALIMALVGSLCFFLIEVFYRGPDGGSVRWVMFWFVVAIVLVSRIAIEKSSEYAALYGLALAGGGLALPGPHATGLAAGHRAAGDGLVLRPQTGLGLHAH